MTAETAVTIRMLREDDDRESFDSGHVVLDDFFRRYAGQNQFRHHIGVTCVATLDTVLIGFVTVSPAMLDADDLPSGKRMPPYPLPVLRVARLAVATAARGRGVGRALLRFAIELAERQRDEVGCVGMLVDAKPDAVDFYAALGFVSVEAVAGSAPTTPRATPMYLPLGSVPRR